MRYVFFWYETSIWPTYSLSHNFFRFACFQNGKRKIGGFERLSFFESTNSQFFLLESMKMSLKLWGGMGTYSRWDSILMITLVSRITSPVRLFFVRIFFPILYVWLKFSCTFIYVLTFPPAVRLLGTVGYIFETLEYLGFQQIPRCAH